MRTALYLVLAGIAFFQLEGLDNIKWMGYVMLTLSGALLIFGLYRYFALKKHLHQYYRQYERLPEEMRSK